jgi:hypothetical protein
MAGRCLKKSIVVSLLLLVGTVSFGQSQPAICPKHIEKPLARQTRLMGEIVLSVTIDADVRLASSPSAGVSIDACTVTGAGTYRVYGVHHGRYFDLFVSMMGTFVRILTRSGRSQTTLVITGNVFGPPDGGSVGSSS